MAQSVVTELVIDSSAASAGADQFSSAMGKASASAQQGVGTVAGLTLAVAGVGVGFVGALAALRGFVDYVGNTNKELIDLAMNAEKAGMTTKSFQETLFAAKASGLTDKDFVSGLDKIGADLQAASRGATDFGKLFEANGVSIKQANGELKTTEQAMGDISNLIKNAPTLQMANAIASIVGLSKDWVPFLRQGVDGIEAQKKSAADLGVTIDDATIQKAKDFNNQWHTAIATWDLQFKASLMSILPMLVQMATLASTIIDGVGAVSGSASRWMTPDEDKSKQQLAAQQDDVLRLIDLMNKAGDAGQGLQIHNLQGLLGLPEGASISQVNALLDKLNSLYDKAPTKLTVTPSGNGSTVLPASGAGGGDSVDHAIDRLTKHTEQQLADAKAVGLGDAALAGFRAEAAETAAVMANGGKETDKQIDAFSDLRDKAIAAADALAKAKVASSIDFGSKTAFLSAQDVSIANQLKGIYGNDVPRALASTEAAAIRVNDVFRQVSSGIENNLVTGLTDIATGSVNAAQGFSNMGIAVLKTIEQMIIKIAVVQPMMAALQNSIGGGSILGLLGFGGSSAPTAGLDGLAAIHHTGGIVGGDSMPSRYVHPAYFDNAPRFHTGGIAGDEVPIIAKRGEGVFTQGQMAAMGGGGQQTTINYAPTIDARGADAATVARLATVLAQDHKNFERNVQGIMAKTRQNNPGT